MFTRTGSGHLPICLFVVPALILFNAKLGLAELSFSQIIDPDFQGGAPPFGATSAALGDFDNDGDLDLFWAGSSITGNRNRVFRNEGGGDFSHIESAQPLGKSRGASVADFDNDGDLDIYSYDWNQLLRNEGGFEFSVLEYGQGEDSWITACASWGDVDGDGDTDLYFSNDGGSNYLLRNDGGIEFADITEPPLDNDENGRSAVWLDSDNDGDVDIYLANFGLTSRLFENLAIPLGGGFQQHTGAPLGSILPDNSVAAGDYDNDRDIDLYVTASSWPSYLLRNDGGNQFSNVTTSTIEVTFGWECTWGDLENDGDLDLVVHNELSETKVFRNDGSSGFYDHPVGGALTGWYSIALGDYDGDGDLDLFKGSVGYRNDQDSENHWLHVDLEGTASNRSAIGAALTLHTGGTDQYRQVHSGEGLGSQNSLTVEFGLGTETMVDTLEVRWPSGIIETWTDIAADQNIHLVEGETILTGTGDGRSQVPATAALHPNRPNPFNPVTRLKYSVPAEGTVRIEVFDVAGRLVRALIDTRNHPAGTFETEWNGRDEANREVPSGIYFSRLETAEYRAVRKMVLMR